MAVPMTVEQDVHDLRERMKYIEGWKEGEAERYGRLERDVGTIRTELVELRLSQDRRFDAQDRKFESIDRRVESIDRRFEHLEKRFDRMLWFMMATLGAILAQIATTVVLSG